MPDLVIIAAARTTYNTIETLIFSNKTIDQIRLINFKSEYTSIQFNDLITILESIDAQSRLKWNIWEYLQCIKYRLINWMDWGELGIRNDAGDVDRRERKVTGEIVIPVKMRSDWWILLDRFLFDLSHWFVCVYLVCKVKKCEVKCYALHPCKWMNIQFTSFAYSSQRQR